MSTESRNGAVTQPVRIAAYLGSLALLMGLSNVFAIPVQYFLKDQLHCKASELALFSLISGIPTYAAIIFGFARDRWRFGRLGDRGYFLIFAPMAAVIYVWLSQGELTYSRLLFGIFAATFVGQFISAAYNGLIASVGKTKLMTGRMSTLWNLGGTIPSAITPALGGRLTHLLATQAVFLVAAGIKMLIFSLGFARPKAVFNRLESVHVAPPVGNQVMQLLKHRPLWPAIIIWFLAQFMPGFATPILFYLTDTVKLTAAEFGQYSSVLNLSFLPTMALYGYLCSRFPLSRLLFVATLVMLPQVLPLLFIHSAGQAYACAILMGITGGMASGAYFDLIIRSCPKGMEGAGTMLASAAFLLSTRGSDLFGSWLFQRGGFLWCVIATTTAYALIFPMLLTVPRSVSKMKEGVAGA